MTDGNERRRVRRGRRSLGGSRSATETRGGVLDQRDEDYADLEGEQPDLNAAVRQRAPQPPRPRRPQEEDDFTPRSRMKEVNARGSAYAKEYRLRLLHRMLLRNVPLDEIARELHVSVHTIMRDRRELYRRLRKEASNLDMNEFIGGSLGFYNEVTGMALRVASQKDNPMNSRLAALRTALSSKNDSHRFLQAAGVFDVLSFKASEDGNSSDLDRLMELTDKILGSDDEFEKNKDGLSDLPAIEMEQEDDEEILEEDLRMY